MCDVISHMAIVPVLSPLVTRQVEVGYPRPRPATNCKRRCEPIRLAFQIASSCPGRGESPVPPRGFGSWRYGARLQKVTWHRARTLVSLITGSTEGIHRRIHSTTLGTGETPEATECQIRGGAVDAIDQHYFSRLADWAESDAPSLRDGTPTFGPSDRSETYQLLRRAGYPI